MMAAAIAPIATRAATSTEKSLENTAVKQKTAQAKPAQMTMRSLPKRSPSGPQTNWSAP